MVDQVNGVGAGQHATPQKGMKMSDLAKTNKLLYEYFKNSGVVNDNDVVTKEFIENAKKTLDTDNSGKISVREARTKGFNGTRKEVKAAIGMLDTIANTEIGKDVEFSEAVDDKNTDYYQNGVLKKSVYNDGKREQVKEFEKDGKTPKETRTTVYEGDKKVYSDKTVYHNGYKNYTDMDNDVLHSFTLYYPNTNKAQRSVVTLKDENGKPDKNSTVTTEYSGYGKGQAHTETITYEGKMIEDGITQRVIEYDAEGNEISNTTNLDAAEKADEAAATKDGANVTAKDETAPKAAKDGAKIRPAFVKPQHKVSLPSEWSKKPLPDGVAEELKLADTYTADEVLDKLAEKFEINKAEIQADKLKADLIKYNPSVFDKDGNVFDKADFGKLDFPQNAGELYKQGAELPKVKVKRNNPPAPPKAPVPPKAEEVAKSTTPAIPRDPNPPKQDASGMIIHQAHATGPKNGTLSDINGNVYEYDENGRLERIGNKDGYVTHEYSYDANGKVKFYTEYDGDNIPTRDNQGRVLEYYDNVAHTYRFGNGVAQPKGMNVAKVKDFNLSQKQFEKDNKARNAAEQQRTQRNAQIVKQARADRAKKFEDNLHKYDAPKSDAASQFEANLHRYDLP